MRKVSERQEGDWTIVEWEDGTKSFCLPKDKTRPIPGFRFLPETEDATQSQKQVPARFSPELQTERTDEIDRN